MIAVTDSGLSIVVASSIAAVAGSHRARLAGCASRGPHICVPLISGASPAIGLGRE